MNKNINIRWGVVLAIVVSANAFAQAPGETAPDEPVPAGTHPTAAKLADKETPHAAELVPGLPVSDADLWQRIRRGFGMAELNSALVQEHERWYASRPDYIQRFVDRGTRYLYHVVEEVERRGMPTEVALLPIIESAFNPQAYSRAKAAGMWQFIPSTGKNFGLSQDSHSDNRRDVLLSTHAAMDYLQKLHDMFNSWELAFAAYNCGEGCVGRAIQRNIRKGLPTDYLSLKLPPETRAYVPKLIAVKNIILAPGSYGIELVPVGNRPYFAKVAAPAKMDVSLASRLADMEAAEFAALNPASSKPVAATSTGFFLVPADKADTFRENLEQYRSLNGPMVSWQTITVKRGDAIDTIAKRYGMTPSYLRATSGPFREKKGKLTQPASIMIPMAKEAKIIDATLEKKSAMQALAPRATETIADAAPADSTVLAPVPAVAAIAAVTLPSAPVAASIIRVAETVPAIEPPVTETTRYRIEKGDTLFAIAKRYNLTVEQLKSHNTMKSNAVIVGQELTLPNAEYAVDGVISTNATTEGLMRVSHVPQPVRAKAQTYTVRAGDTLFAIANKFGVALEELMRLNKLTTRSIIQPGNRIRVSA